MSTYACGAHMNMCEYTVQKFGALTTGELRSQHRLHHTPHVLKRPTVHGRWNAVGCACVMCCLCAAFTSVVYSMRRKYHARQERNSAELAFGYVLGAQNVFRPDAGDRALLSQLSS